MDEMADALEEVCASLHSPVIGMGEGAGANILARLALKSPKQLLGAILIHVTSSQAGFLESMQDKVKSYEVHQIFVDCSAIVISGQWSLKNCN